MDTLRLHLKPNDTIDILIHSDDGGREGVREGGRREEGGSEGVSEVGREGGSEVGR